MKEFPKLNKTDDTNGNDKVTTTINEPTDIGESNGIHDKITSEDVLYILDTTLRTEHKQNPFVIGFITAYVTCFDVKQAAKEAGISARDAKMLKNRKDINIAINKITESAVVKYGLDPNEIVEKVKNVAFVDPADLVDAATGAAYENMHDIPIETRRAIKKFEVKNLYEKDANGMSVVVGTLVKFEMWDKLKAIEMLGRETELFKETKVIEHDVTTNMRDVLLESRDRAETKAIEAREVIALERGKGYEESGD